MAEESSRINPHQISRLWCYRCSEEIVLRPNLAAPTNLAFPANLASSANLSCPHCCGGFLECLTAPTIDLGHPPCPALRRRRRPAPSNDSANFEDGGNEDEVLEILRHLFASSSSSSSSSPPTGSSSSSEAMAALLHQQEALHDSIMINAEAKEDTTSDTDFLQLAIAWFSDEEEAGGEEDDPVGLEEGLVDIELSSTNGDSISTREEEEEEEEEAEIASPTQNTARFRDSQQESEGGGNRDNTDNADYTGDPNDYMDDSQGFERLLRELADTDQNNRQGAPPASKTAILSLPLIPVERKHIADESATCAVCKETADIGEWVKQLPCLHLYHEECILPWLCTRNSCPICRFELPTDDPEYERSKRNSQSVSLSASPTTSDLTELQFEDGEELEASSEGGTSEEDQRFVQMNSNISSRRTWQNWVCFTAGSILRAMGFVSVVYLGSHILNTRLDQLVTELQMYLRKLGEMQVPKQWWMKPFKH